MTYCLICLSFCFIYQNTLKVKSLLLPLYYCRIRIVSANYAVSYQGGFFSSDESSWEDTKPSPLPPMVRANKLLSHKKGTYMPKVGVELKMLLEVEGVVVLYLLLKILRKRKRSLKLRNQNLKLLFMSLGLELRKGCKI